MTTANEKQISNKHYAAQYQHWDWVHDVGLGYHAGNATKYITRAFKKNGKEDLQKALHYIAKCEELQVPFVDNGGIVAKTVKLAQANDLTEKQKDALISICFANWSDARHDISAIQSAL